MCDTVLSGFIAFIILETLLKRCIKKGTATLILSILFSLCVCAAVFLVLRKKQTTSENEKGRLKRLERILAKLELCTDNELIDLFLPIFMNESIKIKIIDNVIVTDTKTFTFDYSETTSRQTAVDAVKKSHGKHAVLFCHTPDSNCLEFAEKQKGRITLLDKNVILQLEKTYKITFPEEVASEKKPLPQKILAKIKSLANFRRALTLALSGAMLCLFSRLSFFRVWYTIWGISLLAAAATILIIKILRRTPKIHEKEELNKLFFG